MFLDVLRRRNPALIEAAIALHQAGALPANCTVIDLDAVTENARAIREAADAAGLKVFAMTKQMGRNGDFCRAVAAGGIGEAVAVDMDMRARLRRGRHEDRPSRPSGPGAAGPRRTPRPRSDPATGRCSTTKRRARRAPPSRQPGKAARSGSWRASSPPATRSTRAMKAASRPPR